MFVLLSSSVAHVTQTYSHRILPPHPPGPSTFMEMKRPQPQAISRIRGVAQLQILHQSTLSGRVTDDKAVQRVSLSLRVSPRFSAALTCQKTKRKRFLFIARDRSTLTIALLSRKEGGARAGIASYFTCALTFAYSSRSR